MTKREAAIVSAYTGLLCGEFSYLQEHIEQLLGRPVFTHELPYLAEEIEQKSKKDFCNLQIEQFFPGECIEARYEWSKIWHKVKYVSQYGGGYIVDAGLDTFIRMDEVRDIQDD